MSQCRTVQPVTASRCPLLHLHISSIHPSIQQSTHPPTHPLTFTRLLPVQQEVQRLDVAMQHRPRLRMQEVDGLHHLIRQPPPLRPVPRRMPPLRPQLTPQAALRDVLHDDAVAALLHARAQQLHDVLAASQLRASPAARA